MKIIRSDDPELIKIATEVLNSGGLVIYPTETCYGVGVDATNSEAIKNVLEYKRRPEGKAISIAVNNKRMANEFVEITENAEMIFKNFLPGPITVVCKSKGMLDKRLEAENGSLGIRIPNNQIVLNLITMLKKPITSTSANTAGKKTPYSIDDILTNISERQKRLVGLIIDAGELPHNPPSTVIDTTSDILKVYRKGQINPTNLKLIASITTNSEEETIEFGESFVKKYLLNNNLILLNGELGAGKTHLVKGIAKGVGITQIIKSPTYNYLNEYKLQDRDKKLIHLDAWRIVSKEDLNALGFYQWFDSNNIIFIEWPTVISNLDEEIFERIKYLNIEFVKLEDNRREIKLYEKNP